MAGLGFDVNDGRWADRLEARYATGTASPAPNLEPIDGSLATSGEFGRRRRDRLARVTLPFAMVGALVTGVAVWEILLPEAGEAARSVWDNPGVTITAPADNDGGERAQAGQSSTAAAPTAQGDTTSPTTSVEVAPPAATVPLQPGVALQAGPRGTDDEASDDEASDDGSTAGPTTTRPRRPPTTTATPTTDKPDRPSTTAAPATKPPAPTTTTPRNTTTSTTADSDDDDDDDDEPDTTDEDNSGSNDDGSGSDDENDSSGRGRGRGNSGADD